MNDNPLLTLPIDARTLAAGATWYHDYGMRATRLGARYGYGRRESLAAFAALSPRLGLRANVHALYRAMVAHSQGLDVSTVNRSMPGKSGSGVMGHRLAAAFKALSGNVREALGGVKVRSFYLNLRGRLSEVTIDTWAAQPFGIAAGKSISKGAYLRIREMYRQAARIFNVAPAVLQAAVWIYLRGKAD